MIKVKSHVSFLNYILFQVDMLVFMLACFCVYGEIFSSRTTSPWWFVYIIGISHISFFVADLYDVEEVLKKKALVVKYAGAYSIIFILLMFSSFLYSGALTSSRNNILEVLFISAVFVLLWRSSFIGFLSDICPGQRVLILGADDNSRVLWDEIQSRKEKKWNVVGFLGKDMYLRDTPDQKGKKIPEETALLSLVEEKNIDCVVVAFKDLRGSLNLDDLLNCKVRKNVEVIDFSSFYEKITGKIWIDNLRPSWLIFSSGFGKTIFYKGAKRLFDILFSIFLLVVSFPAAFLAAILVKVTSKGSFLFSQERIGMNGKPYTLYKFRTMEENAEKGSGPVWAGENDPRITNIGKVLRKWRIDEIPQIWNVLKGDMSFVGPRPERAFFIEKLKIQIPYYELRLGVKPGITGWAAVRFQYGATVEDAKEKLKYDLYYIKSCSILLDFIIFLKTINVVLYGKGAR